MRVIVGYLKNVERAKGGNVGQASKRGTFEERKTQSIAKREERQQVDREAYLQRQAERDSILDREYQAREAARREGRPIGVIGTGGFGSGGRRGKSMMVMAAMLAAMGDINIRR